MIKQFALAIAMFSLTQFSRAAPAPEMAQLDYFKGNWACVEHEHANGKPAQEYKYSAHYAPILDGAWQEIIGTDAGKTKPYYRGYWGYDREKKTFVIMAIMSGGTSGVSTSNGWNGDILVLESVDKKARGTITKKGATDFVGTLEWQEAGGGTSETNCHKVK